MLKFVEDLDDNGRSILESFTRSSICERLKHFGLEANSDLYNILGLRRWNTGGKFDLRPPKERLRNPSRFSFSYKLKSCNRLWLDVIITWHLTQMLAVAAITNRTMLNINYERVQILIDRRLDKVCSDAYLSYFEVRKVKLFIQRFFSLALAIQKKLTIHFVPFTRFFSSLKGFSKREKKGKQDSSPQVVGYDEWGIPIFADKGPINHSVEPEYMYDSDSYYSDYSQDSYSW